MINYLTLNICAELLCFITACVFLWQDKQAVWRSLVLFLLFTCTTELAGKIMNNIHQNNSWIYNLYIIAEAGINLTMLASLISRYAPVKLPFLFTGIVLVACYIAECFKHGMTVFHNITAVAMSVFYVAYGLYYLYLLMRDERDFELLLYAPFWWVAGTICFAYCSSVSDLYFTIASNENKKHYTYRHTVFIILNLILYGCWSYSFVCRYLQRKSIRS